MRHWSTAQATVALSSGEAELGGLCRGAANGIGLQSLAKDLGLDWNIKMYTDATAAIGMTRRLGVGKIRHLDTSLLWIQSKVRSGQILLEKVLGVENPADSLTKHLTGPQIQAHLTRMALFPEDGRAASAPAFSPQ